MLKAIFLFFLILILYIYFGYPFLLTIISFFSAKPIKKRDITPFVSIIISVYNEEGVIRRKIKNCLELDYPKDKTEIMIGSDNSNDNTNQIINEYGSYGIICCEFKERRGKISVLNDLIQRARGEIIIFTDARQMLDKNAVKELVSNFADEAVGGVSGELFISGKEVSIVSEGVGLYWNYEKFLRKKESQIGSTVGATGAIYAVRKSLYVPPEADTLLDDMFIPMKIIEKGYRVIFDPNAKAYDTFSKTPGEEANRKIRTLVGNWQLFFRLRNMFNPFKSKIAIQFFSHKLLRISVPYFLLMILITNIFLLDNNLYKTFFALQIIFYLSALTGRFLIKHHIRLFNIPYIFCMLNYIAMKSFFIFLTNKQRATWK